MVLARNFDQYMLLARLIALKYPSLESLTSWMVSLERCFFMVHMALLYSLRSAVRWRDYQGLDLGEGCERDVTSRSMAVREFKEAEN